MSGQGGFTSIIFMVAMFAIFYFMLIRPQRKRDKQVKDMRSSLKKGDEIITIGGIQGKVVKVNDEIIVVELDHAKQRLKMQKWAIHSVINPSKEKEVVEKIEEPVEVVEDAVVEAVEIEEVVETVEKTEE
jgi:preprotein translocase subunit YajC